MTFINIRVIDYLLILGKVFLYFRDGKNAYSLYFTSSVNY